MYAARTKITDLEAQNATLTKTVEDVEADKERVELREQTDKSESLEIDLEAERVKAATAEEAKQKADEAREISSFALNIANSILNASELDAAVAALIDALGAVGHRGGYLECAQYVEEAFGEEFDVSHCSVTDHVDAALARTEGVYDHLSLPVMDLVAEALKHDDWCQCLKTIIDPP
ncbi:hypothetical protein Hanom_Chr16g01455141 [Helianthus anomalus]